MHNTRLSALWSCVLFAVALLCNALPITLTLLVFSSPPPSPSPSPRPAPPICSEVDEQGVYMTYGNDSDTWMQDINEQRPPSPPRGRGLNGPSLATF